MCTVSDWTMLSASTMLAQFDRHQQFRFNCSLTNLLKRLFRRAKAISNGIQAHYHFPQAALNLWPSSAIVSPHALSWHSLLSICKLTLASNRTEYLPLTRVKSYRALVPFVGPLPKELIKKLEVKFMKFKVDNCFHTPVLLIPIIAKCTLGIFATVTRKNVVCLSIF